MKCEFLYGTKRFYAIFIPTEFVHWTLSGSKWMSNGKGKKNIIRLAPNAKKCSNKIKLRRFSFFLSLSLSHFDLNWWEMIEWHRSCLWFKCKFIIQRLYRVTNSILLHYQINVHEFFFQKSMLKLRSLVLVSISIQNDQLD